MLAELGMDLGRGSHEIEAFRGGILWKTALEILGGGKGREGKGMEGMEGILWKTAL